MSRSFNQVILVGNIGRDAETRQAGNAKVTQFSVATSHRFKQGEEWKEETNWTNVVAWNQERVAEFLVKGKQVFVRGRLQTRSYDDKEGKKVYATEVIAEEITLLGGDRGRDSQQDSFNPDTF